MTREMWQEVVPNPDVGLPMDVVCQGYMTGEDDIDRDLRVCEIMMESHAIQLTALKKKNAGLDFKKELAEIKRLNEVKENFLSTYVPPQPPKPAVSEVCTLPKGTCKVTNYLLLMVFLSRTCVCTYLRMHV